MKNKGSAGCLEHVAIFQTQWAAFVLVEKVILIGHVLGKLVGVTLIVWGDQQAFGVHERLKSQLAALQKQAKRIQRLWADVMLDPLGIDPRSFLANSDRP